MNVVCKADSYPLEPLSEVTPRGRDDTPSPTSDSPSHSYKIEEIQQSPSAVLFFARDVDTGESIVIKKLCEYRDTRYSLETRDKRQQCQLEAIRRNRLFSPEFYLGLARLYDIDHQQEMIYTSEALEAPREELPDPEAEYVLLMQQLPKDRRLDHLLETGSEDTFQPYLFLLTEHMIAMHERLEPLEDGAKWGGHEFLQEKCRQNLELLDFLLEDHAICQAYPRLISSLPSLKERFKEVAARRIYGTCFEQRVIERRIKFCHGDVKSPHIWIMPGNGDGKPKDAIKLLDAIDFNPLFNHIDVLSDFAMLVADVHARTRSPRPANTMIDTYLRQSNQDNTAARAVLDYYIIEKAIVGTGISFLYDGLPQLGLQFLDVAESRLEALYAVAVLKTA